MTLRPVSRRAERLLDLLFKDLPEGRYRKIDNSGAFMAVHLEHQTENLYSVAHFYEQNGDMVPDPMMLFLKHTEGETQGYYPVTIEQPLGGYRVLLRRDGDHAMQGPDFRHYDGARSLTETWMKNIQQQQGLDPLQENKTVQLRLKQKQTPDVCVAYRCKRTPGGQYLGIGYLCNDHAEKVLPAHKAGTLKLVGADPLLGNDPTSKAQAPDEPLEPAAEAAQVQAPVAPVEAAEPPADGEDAWRDDLAAQKSELADVLGMLESFEVETPEDVAFATEELASTKGQWKRWEEQRTKITKPLNAGLREVNALFKPVQGALKTIEGLWKRKIVSAQMAAQREQQRLLQEAQAATQPQEIKTALIAAADAPLDLAPAGVTMRDNWRWEITSAKDVPAELWAPCPQRIADAVKGGATDIPGVRVWNDPILSSPSK